MNPTICWKLLKLTGTRECDNLVDVTMDNQQETEKDPQRLHVGDLYIKIKIQSKIDVKAQLFKERNSLAIKCGPA